jgi:hypothetical protein
MKLALSGIKQSASNGGPMYILIGIALYAFLAACLVRVFQSIHRRDDEIRTMSSQMLMDPPRFSVTHQL